MGGSMTTVGSLMAGDRIVDADGLELEVLAVEVAGRRSRVLSVKYVDEAMLICRPGVTRKKVSVNAMVQLPPLRGGE